MNKMLIILIIFLVIFFIYILNSKVKDYKLESFYTQGEDNCDTQLINKDDIGTALIPDTSSDSINLSFMNNMCRNYGFEVNSPDYLKKENNVFYGDCEVSCLSDPKCLGFNFIDKNKDGIGDATYYTVQQIGGLDASRMKESLFYNSSSGYNSVSLRSSEKCINKTSGYIPSSTPGNKGNFDRYVNPFQIGEQEYYNNIIQNNYKQLTSNLRDIESCYDKTKSTLLCNVRKVFNFTLDEDNPQFLYIYTFTDDFVFQIWRVANKSMSNCLDPNNLIPLNKPFKVRNIGNWNNLPIKMQVFRNDIYYSTINQYIFRLSLNEFNDTKTLDTSQASDFWRSILGSFKLYKDNIYFINNRFGGNTGASTVVCYFAPGDHITIRAYETANHYNGNIKDFDICNYNSNIMLIGLAQDGNLIMKSSPDGFWRKYKHRILLSICIDSREDPEYIYGRAVDNSSIIRKKIRDIRNNRSMSSWEPVISLPVFRFKIYNFNSMKVIFYIDMKYSLHAKVLPA